MCLYNPDSVCEWSIILNGNIRNERMSLLDLQRYCNYIKNDDCNRYQLQQSYNVVILVVMKCADKKIYICCEN